MPERRKKAAASGEDRISTLPDALLLHTLSLLASEEAVRTCVLARRWRNLWRYTPSLRLIHDDDIDVDIDVDESSLVHDDDTDFDKPRFSSAEHFNKFVSHLIVLRHRSPLVNCEIELYPDEDPGTCQYIQAVQLWIQYALACQVQLLNIFDNYGDQRLLLNVPFISSYLMTVHLRNVSLECSMNLSSCLVLENLEMTHCNIFMHKISSKSLKRLNMTECFFRTEVRTRFSFPGLLSLHLEDGDFRTPLLENMPLLETAFIRLEERCLDRCDNGDGNCDQESCEGCYGFHHYQSVLLNGLSNAINLELLAEPKKYIFRRDVAWCPIFGRLKTLVLNEWCVAVDMYSLVRVLQRSPILEKLTLQINNNRVHVSQLYC
uniref:F-box domain-containing protein n=1 Tax=Aegilops tauschii subsp. strangulata TaxID=200361 RepID=A0A453HJV7_AEGTS